MQTTPLRRELRTRQGYRPTFFIAWGLLLWLAATITFRFCGQWIFSPDNPIRLGAAYYGVLPLIAAVTLPLYRLRQLNPDAQVRAATLIALPGMLLTLVTTLLLDELLPNLSAGARGSFASWFYWAYGLILISGFIPLKRRQG